MCSVGTRELRETRCPRPARGQKDGALGGAPRVLPSPPVPTGAPRRFCPRRSRNRRGLRAPLVPCYTCDTLNITLQLILSEAVVSVETRTRALKMQPVWLSIN